MTSRLAPFLDSVRHKYHHAEWLASDPLEFVHRFSDPWDQEVVAIVSSQLAYGNVKQIRRSLEDLLARFRRISPTPAQWVRQIDTPAARQTLEGFVHRLHRGNDVHSLLRLVARSWNEFGSVGAHLVSRLSPEEQNFSGALNVLLGDWSQWHESWHSEGISRSLGHFLAAPRSGSCCKRWCMLMRWMGRRDELDPGLWMPDSPLLAGVASGRGLLPRQLVLPLDTHVGQICQFIGLTRRKSLNWRAAVEITEKLRQLDPEDPIRPDFSLARLGIVDRCRKKYVAAVCGRCELRSVCTHARRRKEVVK